MHVKLWSLSFAALILKALVSGAGEGASLGVWGWALPRAPGGSPSCRPGAGARWSMGAAQPLLVSWARTVSDYKSGGAGVGVDGFDLGAI